MAIVNTISQGGYVNPYQGAGQVTAALQGQQQLSQQNLQEQQRNAFTYLQMLPQLAQQMGYAPEQLHLFLQEQAPQIKGQLGVLGVADPEGAFNGMVKETTLGQRVQGQTTQALDATQARLEEEAKRLYPNDRAKQAEYVLKGQPGTADVVKEITPATEAKTLTIREGGEVLDALANKYISGGTIDGGNYKDLTQDLAQQIIDADLNPADTAIVQDLINRTKAGQLNSFNELSKIAEIYNKQRTEGVQQIDLASAQVPENMFDVQVSNEALNSIYHTPLTAEEINRAQTLFGPSNNPEADYQRIANDDVAKANLLAKAEAMDQAGQSPDPNDEYIIRRILMETQPKATAPQYTTATLPEARRGETVRTETIPGTPAVTETIPGQPGTEGLAAYSQRLAGEVGSVNPLAGEFVQPGEQAFKAEESRRALIDAQAKQIGQSNAVAQDALAVELFKAQIEQDTTAFNTYLTEWYKLNSEIYKEQLGFMKNDAEKMAFLNAKLDAFATSGPGVGVIAAIQKIDPEVRVGLFRRAQAAVGGAASRTGVGGTGGMTDEEVTNKLISEAQQ